MIETRRTYLLAALRTQGGGPVTTKRALNIYAKSGEWATVGRNTARRDLRDLARRAYLVPAEHRGVRFYTLGRNPSPAHPARGVRKFVLEAIQTEGGEWTTGRVRRMWHQLIGTHVLRMSVRRYLAALHRDGYLDRHGDGTPRRFYTVRKDSA
jgi:DNA-binding IclR family transcriptional regulator